MNVIMSIGKILGTPVFNTSPKGVQYLKFKLEIPAERDGMWPERADVVMFGNQAAQVAAQIPTPGYVVSVAGRPKGKGYVDKNGKAQGYLEIVAREIKVHAAPFVPQEKPWTPPNEQIPPLPMPAIKETNFGDDDIPF
jgi:single-stranded DNA-binding protein